MTPQDRRSFEIEQGERWLCEVCQDHDQPDVNRIKQRVRIAIQEQWLAEQVHDQPPADLHDRAKRRIRAALVASRNSAGKQVAAGGVAGHARRVYRWAGGFGAVAAACVLAAVGLYRLTAAQDELPLVTAFEQFAADDFTASLAELDGDLFELELTFGQGLTRRTRSNEDAMLEDLLDAIDSVMWETDFDDDWS